MISHTGIIKYTAICRKGKPVLLATLSRNLNFIVDHTVVIDCIFATKCSKYSI